MMSNSRRRIGIELMLLVNTSISLTFTVLNAYQKQAAHPKHLIHDLQSGGQRQFPSEGKEDVKGGHIIENCESHAARII